MSSPFLDDSKALLSRRLNELKSIFGSDYTKIFEELYQQVPDPDQKSLFSLLHFQINSLIHYMYTKNNGHYNAEQSRDLLKIIEVFRIMKTKLNGTSYSFKMDSEYESLLQQCLTFLAPSHGSTIPDDLLRIELIDHRPIFQMEMSVALPNNPLKTYPLSHTGEGSYAHVYKYKDEQYDSFVAVKRAKRDLTPEEIVRFKNEFEDLKGFDSPFIIKAYNFDEEKMQYSMEYADETLDSYITRMNDRLTMNERIRLIKQVFQAFRYIHDKGMLHRDISYTNILIKHHDDKMSLIKVCDFGLVKHPDRNLTRQGTEIKGVLNDPSLARTGFENFEIRHDIYALAFVIYFILTGKKNGISVKDEVVEEFFNIALNSDISKRFSNIPEMSKAFEDIIPNLNVLKKE